MRTPRWIRRPFAIVTILALAIMAGLGLRTWIARKPVVIFVGAFTADGQNVEAAALAERLTTATRVALGASRSYQISATAVRADLSVVGHVHMEAGSAVVQVALEGGARGRLWSATLGGDTGRLVFLVPQNVADATDAQLAAWHPK